MSFWAIFYQWRQRHHVAMAERHMTLAEKWKRRAFKARMTLRRQWRS
jgi:hypothetical protein